jgi:ribosomal protein L7Ae-like RNA K-turn-binding protein
MGNNIALVGLAKKAGFLVVGEESVSAAVRTKKARALLSADDASPRSVRQAKSFSAASGIPHVTLPYTKEELGAVAGRGTPGMLAITDIGIAAKLVAKLAADDPERYGAAAETLGAKAAKMLERRREALAHKRNLRTGKRRRTL